MYKRGEQTLSGGRPRLSGWKKGERSCQGRPKDGPEGPLADAPGGCFYLLFAIEMSGWAPVPLTIYCHSEKWKVLIRCIRYKVICKGETVK